MMEKLKINIPNKEKQIPNLNTEVNKLKNKTASLESHLDGVEQYERRDNIIISGPMLPPGSPTEDTGNVALNTI